MLTSTTNSIRASMVTVESQDTRAKPILNKRRIKTLISQTNVGITENKDIGKLKNDMITKTKGNFERVEVAVNYESDGYDNNSLGFYS